MSTALRRDEDMYFPLIFGDGRHSSSLLNEGTSPIPFACLTDVFLCGHMGPDYPPYSVPALHFHEALFLPSLRRLRGHRVRSITSLDMYGIRAVLGSAGTQFSHTLAAKSSSLEHLETRSSMIHDTDLEHWLQACKPGVLKTFIYAIGLRDYPRTKTFKQFTEALRPHFDTLHSLSITVNTDNSMCPGLFCPGDELEPQGFRDFHCLKRLKLSPSLIWGTNGYMDTSYFQ